jgi:ATP/maltotriose-dependent transcriptional regulator MalT
VGGPPAAGALVGRDAELAVLESLAAQAAAGVGGVVLLSGEPGIGKTRLAREAAGRTRDATVSWGACRECEGAPPLWPWLQVLGWLGGERTATTGAADGAAARFQLFERAGHALRESAAVTPRLIVVDDLHRADEASLRLLAYLSETLWPVPLGMIVTFRDTEVPSASLAASVIASLAHGRDSRRLELAGLSERSVAQWLRDAGVPGVDAADLHSRTGGNPLFIAESIRLFAAGSRPGTPLRSVGEVIRERLAPLPADCREALEIASILGRDFEYPPLAAALRVSPDRAVAALDPAVSARLVYPAEARGGAYRFVHTLIRDAVEQQLPPSRRAHLHALAFTALRDTGWGQPSDLAHHAVQARPNISDEVAADAVRSAADAADRLLAWEDAAAWWRMAITLTPPGQVDTGLQMRLGRSLLLAGRVDEARTCFEAAAGEAARTGDGIALAASALAVGETVAEVAADQKLVTLLDRARRHPGVPDGQRVRLLARWAIATYWQPGGQDQSRDASLAATQLAEQAGDTEALGAALIARQFTLRGPGLLDERLAAGSAVLDIATRLGDEDLRFRAHQWLVPDRYQAGAIGLVTADVAAMAEIAEAQRNPLQRWWVLIYRALLAIFAGRAAEGEELAHEAAALGRRLGLPAADAYRVGQLGRIYWAAGRLAELENDIGHALRRFPGLVTLRCMRALASASAGRTAEAARDIDALVADGFAALPRDLLYLASLAILGEAAVACQATDRARPILDELLPYASRNLIQGVPVGWGAAAWHIARLQWLLGRRGDAARSATAAQRLHRQWGAGGLGHPLSGLGQDARAVPLSERELEVLTLLACGQANSEIAASLGVSVHTIERHVANAFTKLGVKNRAAATAWAYRRGLVS